MKGLLLHCRLKDMGTNGMGVVNVENDRGSVRLRILLLAVPVLLIIVSVGALLYVKADYRDVFLRNRAELSEAREVFTHEDARFNNYELTLEDKKGRELSCLVRAPKDATQRYPAIVALDGYRLGKKVINHFTGAIPAVLISFDWPTYKGRGFEGEDIGLFLVRIRHSLIGMISMLPMVVDYLEQRPDVDKTRIIGVGISLGVPAIVDGAAIDKRIRAVALLYGGGDMFAQAEHSSASWIQEPWKRKAFSWFVGSALAPVESLKYVDSISPRPILMINGKEDPNIPDACVRALFDKAGEPKSMVWMETGHVAPEMDDLVARLEQLTAVWLEEENIL